MTNLETFAANYVALWNEPDTSSRSAAITRLWSVNGIHTTASMHCIGYEQIDARVTSAHDRFVATGLHTFELDGPIDGHHNTARFHWLMRDTGTGAVAGGGFDFVVFDDEGRLTADYQYPAQISPA